MTRANATAAEQSQTAADRLRKSLAVPASLMGGKTFIFSSKDVLAVLDQHAELLAALKAFSSHESTMEDILFPDMPSDAIATITIQFRHLRAARAAIAKAVQS